MLFIAETDLDILVRESTACTRTSEHWLMGS